MLRFYLLGPFRVERDGQPLSERVWRSRQERRLLGALVLARATTLPVGRLIEWLWPGADHDDAAITLRSAISSLRRILEPDAQRASNHYIETRPSGYSWVAQGVWVDLYEFQRLLDQTAGPPSDEHLAHAIQLYRGAVLEDEPDAPWAMALREQTRERYLRAVEDLGERSIRRAAYPQATSLVRQGLMIDPLREPLCRMLMQALAREGDIAAALQAYEQFRLLLDHELGASPSAATLELHAAILRGELPQNPPALADEQRATGWVRVSTRPLRSSTELQPIVGRSNELAQLRAWVAGLERRQGAVITLIGEAGMGKTRLLAEVERTIRLRQGQPIMLRCAPLDHSLPFASLAEALRPLARSAPDQLLRRLPASSMAQLAELIPALRDRVPGLPTLPTLPPDEARTRLVEGVVELALALARLTPLVVCVDDAHLADEPLLAALGQIGRHTSQRAILIVLAYRPEELPNHGGFHSLLRTLGKAMLLKPVLLGPLEQAAAMELLLGTNPRPDLRQLARQLAEQTGGNPLFLTVAAQAVTETYGVRSLASLPGPLEPDLVLPDLFGSAALRDLVHGRLERLPGPAHDLLLCLAVLGRPASLDLIEGLGDATALEQTQLLLDRRLLQEDADQQLSMVHEIIRRTVLGSIGTPRRRLIHRRIAEALIALNQAEPAEIAQHLLEAGRGYEQQLKQYAQLAAELATTHGAHQHAAYWRGVAAGERPQPF